MQRLRKHLCTILVLLFVVHSSARAQEIYAVTSDGNLSEWVTGEEPTPILATGLYNVTGMVSSGTNLFILDGPTILEYTVTGQLVSNSLITGLTNANSLAISGTNLFVGYGGNTIGEYTTGGQTVNAALFTGLNGTGPIAVSGTDLFMESPNYSVGEYSTSSGQTLNPSLINQVDHDGGDMVLSGSNLFFAVDLADGLDTDDFIAEYSLSGQEVNSLFSHALDPGPMTATDSELAFWEPYDYDGSTLVVEIPTAEGAQNAEGLVQGSQALAITFAVPEPQNDCMLLVGIVGIVALSAHKSRLRKL